MLGYDIQPHQTDKPVSLGLLFFYIYIKQKTEF